MRDTFICDHCHQEHPISQLRTFDGQNLCVNCRDSETVLCDECGDRIWANRDLGDCGIHLCGQCREDYAYCCDCGQLVHVDRLHYLNDDDNVGYCESCYYLPSYMDSVSGWLGIDYGFGEEYGDAALNEEANIERAKELYDEYFAAEGFPDITCTLVVYKSNGEWLGEFSYPQSTPSASGTSEGNTTADVDYSWIEGTYLLAHAAMIQLNLSFSTPRPWENGDDWGINWSITESNFDGSVDILGEGTATYVGGGECPEFRGTFDSEGSSIQLKYDGYNFVVNCESLRLDGDGSFFKA